MFLLLRIPPIFWRPLLSSWLIFNPLQRALMACYQPAKNSNISKSFSFPQWNIWRKEWALFVWLEAWKPFCLMSLQLLHLCVSDWNYSSIKAVQWGGGLDPWSWIQHGQNAKMQLCKSRRVTMTTPAMPVRPFEQHFLFLRLFHVPSDTFTMIFSKTKAECVSAKHTRGVLIRADQQWLSAISNCSVCSTGAKGKALKTVLQIFQITCAAGHILGHYSWKNIWKLNVFHDWSFILSHGFAVILYCAIFYMSLVFLKSHP